MESPRDRRRDDAERRPERARLVLATLTLVAARANLNISIATVALPSIGHAFDSSQTMLNLVALGDRYGRKLMLVLGTALAIPIVAPVTEALLQGDDWAYIAGVVAFLLGAALVAAALPRRDEERELLAAYHAEDAV